MHERHERTSYSELFFVIHVLHTTIMFFRFLGHRATGLTAENFATRVAARFEEINVGYRRTMRATVRREGSSVRRKVDMSLASYLTKACELEKRAEEKLAMVGTTCVC